MDKNTVLAMCVGAVGGCMLSEIFMNLGFVLKMWLGCMLLRWFFSQFVKDVKHES